MSVIWTLSWGANIIDQCLNAIRSNEKCLKKQHLICSNFTLFIVPFHFQYVCIFFCYFFFSNVFQFPISLAWRQPHVPLKWRPWWWVMMMMMMLIFYTMYQIKFWIKPFGGHLLASTINAERVPLLNSLATFDVNRWRQMIDGCWRRGKWRAWRWHHALAPVSCMPVERETWRFPTSLFVQDKTMGWTLDATLKIILWNLTIFTLH